MVGAGDVQRPGVDPGGNHHAVEPAGGETRRVNPFAEAEGDSGGRQLGGKTGDGATEIGLAGDTRGEAKLPTDCVGLPANSASRAALGLTRQVTILSVK